MFTPTTEQTTLLSTFSDTKESIIVSAFAGCAKTTSIELLAKTIPRHTSTLIVAFNVKIKEELERRLSKTHCQVMTMNALGNAALRNGLGKSFTLDNNKPYRLLREILISENIALPKADQPVVLSLYRKAMMAGLVPSDFPHESLLPDEPDTWQDLEWDASANAIFVARLLLIRSINEALAGTITYDDQIYISTMFGGRFPRFALVIVDEAQDLPPMNHRMIAKAAVSRIIAVGDEKQSIYAWRGADTNSMSNIRKLRPSFITLPLTLTFRCPKLIVRRNAHHAIGFRAADTNLEGTYYAHTNPWSVENTSLAILCRNNAPLLSLAFKLLRRGIPVTFLGRDIGKSLISLFSKICPDPSTGMDEMVKGIKDWQTLELAKTEDVQKRESINDRAESLLTVLDSNCRTARDFSRKLEILFAQENANIILSTIHRAKGLEFDTVIHLDSWRLDPERLFDKYDTGYLTEEQLAQELNLKYVVETRTKNKLIEAPIALFNL